MKVIDYIKTHSAEEITDDIVSACYQEGEIACSDWRSLFMCKDFLPDCDCPAKEVYRILTGEEPPVDGEDQIGED